MFSARALLVASLLAALSGCSQDRSIPTQPLSMVPHFTTAPVTRTDSVVLVHHVAKHLAMSLADRRLRSMLLAALTRTTARESKLHLQRFLRNRGAVWGALVSERSQLGERGWVEEVKLLPDLEMYLPRESYRRDWKGTEDILVLGEVRDEADIRSAGGHYMAFDIYGNALQLPMNEPPSRPVLSLVPIETNFSQDGEAPGYSLASQETCPDGCGGGGGGSGGGPPAASPGDSLILYRSDIHNIDQYEGFAAGNPELMVVLKAYNPTTGHYSTILNCAGEAVAAPRGFNQENNTWTGRAFMGARNTLQTYIGYHRDPMFWVWENDSGENCNFEPSDEDTEYTVAAAAAAGTGAGITAIIANGSPANWAYTIASAVLGVAAYWHASAGDEFIGIVTVPEGSNPSMNPKVIMHEEPPQIRGKLYMQFRPQN